MKPAMTKEEWAQYVGCGLRYGDPEWRKRYESDMHRLMALSSHGQPFGFTREDVAHLRQAAYDLEGEWGDLREDEVRALETLTDRIEALLPPEEG